MLIRESAEQRERSIQTGSGGNSMARTPRKNLAGVQHIVEGVLADGFQRRWMVNWWCRAMLKRDLVVLNRCGSRMGSTVGDDGVHNDHDSRIENGQWQESERRGRQERVYLSSRDVVLSVDCLNNK